MNGYMFKTFIFQNEVTHQSQTLQIPIHFTCESIDIQQIINIFRSFHSIQKPLKVKIYDPFQNAFVTINPDYHLDKAFLYSSMIMLKYQIDINFKSQQEFNDGSQQSSEVDKKQRNKQRTIREVIKCVKKWRQIHKTTDKSKQKINLQGAAKLIGIAKKSLDDYYSQLRLAEKFGFNFYENFDNKIGVLRLFVKSHRSKDQKNTKYDKLPKRLRIIQQFEDQQSFRKKLLVKQQPLSLQQIEEIEQTITNLPVGTISTIVPDNEYQKCFYRSFNFMLDDLEMPFAKGVKKDRRAGVILDQELILF